MAPEQKFELLEKYLRGELSTEETVAFEKQLKNDPALQKELSFQKEVIEGIRKARIAELKAMLNNVPVPPVNPLLSGTVAKIIGSVMIVGSISTALYFYLTSDSPGEEFIPVEQPELQESHTETDPDDNNLPEPVNSPDSGETDAAAPKQESTSIAGQPKSQPGTSAQPQLQVYTPEAEELKEQIEKEHRQVSIIEKGFVTSSIEVEVNADSKKYNFHYSFRNNKLVLYGNFEDNLYEILEFISEKDRTVVLYYKNTYYLLDTDKEDPAPLVRIRDKILLDKLKKFRRK